MNKTNPPGPAKTTSTLFYLFFLYILCSSYAHAELIFSAPPRESQGNGQEIYAPIAAHMSKVLGEKVVYKHPKTWLHYQRDMRNDAYDIVFDGPHFISWRMKHLDAEAVLKLPGFLQFYLVAKKDNADISSADALIAKTICGVGPPNLATLWVLTQFTNPIRQPIIHAVKGGFKGVYKEFKAGKCDAAIFRSTFYNKKIPEEERSQFKIILKSPKLPNQGITVSKRVQQKLRTSIVAAFTIDADGIAASQALLHRFGGKAKAFIPAEQDEYVGHTNFLEGIIFGW